MKRFLWILLAASGMAFAQTGQNDYSLNDGQVHFTAPATWVAVMEKRGADPQAIAFDVPNAAPRDSDAIATVTVKTRTLASPSDFASSVQEEMERARAQPGFTATTNDSDEAHSRFRYSIANGSIRHAVEDRFTLLGSISVQVRCQRPLTASSSPAEAASFDAGCAHVFASVSSVHAQP